MNVITQRDGSDALGLAAATPSQLNYDFEVPAVELQENIENIVFAGMGGSSLQAEFAKTWPRLKVPFVVSKEYTVPDFVTKNTLVIVGSYSGNTEESLAALEDARAKSAQIFVLAGGGKLVARADELGLPKLIIPRAVQPRMAVFYAYKALVDVLLAYGMLQKEVLNELTSAVELLEQSVKNWVKETPVDKNPAKQLALQLVGKTPIIYAGPLMAPAAYKWKISVNENAKNTAWMGTLPEFNHNEFLGWSSHPVEKPFAVVDLRSSYEHERVNKRFEVSDRMLSGMRPKAISVQASGNSALEHLLFLVLFGDFVTIYLGLLNGVDPSPVDLVEKFKKELN